MERALIVLFKRVNIIYGNVNLDKLCLQRIPRKYLVGTSRIFYIYTSRISGDRTAEIAVVKSGYSGKMQGIGITAIVPEQAVTKFNKSAVRSKQCLYPGIRHISKFKNTIADRRWHIVSAISGGDSTDSSNRLTVQIGNIRWKPSRLRIIK